MPSFVMFLYLSAATLISLADGASDAKERLAKSILEWMKSSALAFRDEMRRAYAKRCDARTLAECDGGSHNDCSSAFPDGRCVSADELVVSRCREGCGGVQDETTTRVSLPASVASGPTYDIVDSEIRSEIVETVCYSRLAEPYMVDKYVADREYWARYGVYPSYTYFGAHNGLFRQIPGRHREECGAYDPRKRPWFVAASTGPKDVVLVIEISNSMNRKLRLDLAKNMAITVIETLAVADHVAIVTFSNAASQIDGFSGLIRATEENKKLLIDAVNGLEADGGGANFYDPFETAYNILEESIKTDYTSDCNAAILFLTDGSLAQGPGEDEVVALVNDRTQQFSNNYGRKATVFTYSLGNQANDEVMKGIACKTNGIWTPVVDYFGDLFTTMSSYYKFFALGLGEGGNKNFAAWVEPYEFSTTGNMGTTVAVPLYDDSVQPPLFLGVVAVDMYMDTLEEVLGEEASSLEMLNRFIELSTAECPKIELSDCELDALRFLGGGKETTCGMCKRADCAGIVPEKCPTKSVLPKKVWNNTKMEGKSYIERGCCSLSDSPLESETCPVISPNGTSVPAQSEKDFPSLRNIPDYSIDNSFCSSLPTEPDSLSGEQSESNFKLILGITIGIMCTIFMCIILSMGWCVLRRKPAAEGVAAEEDADPADEVPAEEEADPAAAAGENFQVRGLIRGSWNSPGPTTSVQITMPGQDRSNRNLGMSGNANQESSAGIIGEGNGDNDSSLPSQNVAQQGHYDENEHASEHDERENEGRLASESPGGSHAHALQTIQPSDYDINPGSKRQYSRQFSDSSTGTIINAGPNAIFNFTIHSSPISSRQNSAAVDGNASDRSDQTDSTLDRLNLAFLQLGMDVGEIDPIDAVRQVITETQLGDDERDATQEATGPDYAHQPTENDVLFVGGGIVDSNTAGYTKFFQEVEKFKPAYNTDQKPLIPNLVTESLNIGGCQFFDLSFDEQGRPLWIRMSEERDGGEKMARVAKKALGGRLKKIRRSRGQGRYQLEGTGAGNQENTAREQGEASSTANDEGSGSVMEFRSPSGNTYPGQDT